VLALLRAGRPAPGRAPPRAIDYSCGLILFKAPTVPAAHAARFALAVRARLGLVGAAQPTGAERLDLVGRPRSLISRAVSRAGARAERGEVLALLRAEQAARARRQQEDKG
jgi:hypothetical protein